MIAGCPPLHQPMAVTDLRYRIHVMNDRTRSVNRRCARMNRRECGTNCRGAPRIAPFPRRFSPIRSLSLANGPTVEHLRVSDPVKKMIRALVVDDEPLARERLRQLLGEHPDVEIVGDAGNAADAATACAVLAPDVLLLDVSMPMGTGLDLLRTLSPVPAVIFTTAYAEFAVSAFEVNAVDYLLKPIDTDRLAQALTRLRQKLARPDVALPKAAPSSTRLAFRLPSQIVFLRPEEVEWVAAEGNYCRVHTAGKAVLVREMLTVVEQRLDPARFVRVHRSAIINVDMIQKVVVDKQGRYTVVLQSGTTVRVGTTHRKLLQRLIDDVT
ncbi:MAG TPA: LytTR family DNA-binding domain-containing protein [Thermoanaerobaculia bacterium]